MFGVGYQEMLLIGLAALLLFGPGKLPEVMSQAGKWYKQFRDVTAGLTDEFNKTVAEAKTELDGMGIDLGPMQKQVDSISKSVQKDLGGAKKTTSTGKRTTGTAKSSTSSKATTSKSASSKSTTAKKTSTSTSTKAASGTGARTNTTTAKPNMTTGRKLETASKEDPYASLSLFEQPERPTKRRARSATPSALTDLTPRIGEESTANAGAEKAADPVAEVFDADDPISRARQRRLRAGYAQLSA